MADRPSVSVKIEGKGDKIGEQIAKQIARAMGASAGVTAGGTIGVLSLIADAVKDLPIVTSVMKLFKLIIGLLFLPLIPVLVPILQKIGEFIAKITPYIQKISDTLQKSIDKGTPSGQDLFKNLSKSFDSGAFISGIVDFIIGALSNAIQIIVIGIEGLWFTLKSASEPIILGLQVVWKSLQPLFALIVLSWRAFTLLPSYIWHNILLPAFSFLKDAGLWIWNILKSPFEWLRDKMNSFISSIKNAFSFGKHQVGGLISSEGLHYLHRGERVLSATEASRGSSGPGATFNISIDKPQISSKQDIDALIRELERRMQITMRRYTSYSYHGV